MHAPSILGLLVVAVVIILLFGRGKISGVMGEVATGIKSFRNGLKDEELASPLSTSDENQKQL